MKRFGYSTLVILLGLALFTGCATTEKMTSSITSTVSSMTSNVDEEIYAQVPEDQREGISAAESTLKVFEEKRKLTELKEELVDNQSKYAKYTKDIAEKEYEVASLSLDIAKLEAIDRAGLGEKEDNIKNIAKLKSKKLELEGDKIKIEAKISILESKISELTQHIKLQEKVVADMSAADSGAAALKPEDTAPDAQQPEDATTGRQDETKEPAADRPEDTQD